MNMTIPDPLPVYRTPSGGRLQPLETKVLHLLLINEGVTCLRNDMHRALYPGSPGPIKRSRTLDVIVFRLRQVFSDYVDITTIHKKGWMLSTNNVDCIKGEAPWPSD